MSPRRDWTRKSWRAAGPAWAGGVAALVWFAALPAMGRQDIPDVPAADPREASDIVEDYMQKLGLKRLQAEDLAFRLGTATGAARGTIAERLAKLYVSLLSEARSPEDRRMWEDRSRELLRAVPEADSFELRLSLSKALHIQATEALERHRLRLASPEEVTEAERVLKSIRPLLEEIALKVNRRVELMEAMEEKGDTSERLSDDLSEARRLRSQGFYYLGWTNYYLAFVSGGDEASTDALKDFGWILNSRGGRVPSLDRVSPGLFKYEHIARSAAGTALCLALRGNDTGALAWLDAIEGAEDVAPGVRDNLVSWRLTVLASSKRWANLERFVRQVRDAESGGGGADVKRLSVVAARLLAVLVLEADRSYAAEVLDPLAAIAMGDLVHAGEIAHVLDLVKKYGTAPIGEKGFIVNYVRGIQQYELARASHKKVSPEGAPDGGRAPSELPTRDAETIAAYTRAASLLQGAVDEPDAESFKVERAKASMLWGFALYYSGDLTGAAERFTTTAQLAATGAQSEEAMWLAVLTLDQGVEAGDEALTKRRDEAAALYLQTHPDSANAPKLLLRRAMTGALATEEAVRILLGVDRGSPMYAAARQHAARLLYGMYRSARGADRDFAAMRFVGVGEETLTIDRKLAMEGEGQAAADAALRVVARVRQILDALLSTQTPDPTRAETALEILTGVAASHRIDLDAYASELMFRRVQIALAKDDAAGAAGLIAQLQAEGGDGGQFASAADQLMFKRAVDRRNRAEDKEGALRDIVLYGSRVIERMVGASGAMSDGVLLSIHQSVAAAATELWELRSDAAMRDLAVKLDTRLLGAQPGNLAALQRQARNSESAGDTKTALDCWRTLLSGLRAGEPEWFEARYESIRLLYAVEPARAREAMAQHLVLYPTYGPDPWGVKLKTLDEQMGGPGAAAPTPPTPPTPAPGSGKSPGGPS